jgi:N-acetylneuraminic acid mutarotase
MSTNFSIVARRTSFAVAALLAAAALEAGFPSTETFLPAVGRVAGQGGAQFYTTVWATNLTNVPVSFTFDFLKQGQANANPASFSDSLSPGQTKVYENVVETKLGLSNAIGAARVISTGEILLAERIYNQAPGDDVGKSEGLFFAGVPKSFSASLGQSATIQGVNQGGTENFRYNFALVETGGSPTTVNLQLLDGSGTLLGQKAYPLQPYEQLQPNVADVFSGIATTNARITATVTGGTGSVLIAGAQLANESQDSSGFEMSFANGAGCTEITPYASDVWAATSTANAPTGREYFTAVWTGSRMIVWGGDDTTTFFNTGGVYDSVSSSWSATSMTNAPSGRDLHTAVWTGSKMIVWGGYDGSGNVNTGGIYDPVSNTWTATSTTNAPSARNSHSAVWTGTKMIVWGGDTNAGGTLFNTGGIYDPVANSWSPISTAGAPSARDSHAALWTGSKMIVWGGGAGSTTVNTGGIYDPATDSWRATSTTNAPVGGYLNSAVWTGSKMIVWGGYHGFPVNTGGVYDPAADSWSATSMTGAPTARAGHTAVWTGSRMVVWGGSTKGPLANTGGVYDPAANSWRATSTTNAPTARYLHTAVWTGSKMIVWGGWNGSAFFNTGGIWTPLAFCVEN